ncbi:kda protein in nof-fb transposable element [Lasius niger]|uniref:KDa protein in nof-fb transposable element n=1 Tax=Lasius niger TaxID=67767 RepID=A0A0J7KB18_LASNI|nr:kda protein in nof-fb transposable element [Lasius niger]
MPRPPANSPNKIYDALKELWFIDNKGKLLAWDDDVWKKAVDAMKALRKSITLSKSEWDTLKSNILKYKDREYEVLVIGWSDAVYDILWSHLKLPCPFSFKNAKINRNPGKIFLSIKGSCSECKSKIHIYCQSESTGDSPILNISTFDSCGIVHEKKRQVRGDRRIRIGKELQGTSTYAWRRNEANKLMDFGNIVPANLPSEDVARKAKQEAQGKELGLFKVKAALASVWDMKYGQEFNGCIYEIGLDHFYVLEFHTAFSIEKVSEERQYRDPNLLERCDDFDEIPSPSKALDAILEKIETDSTDNLKQGRLNPYHCPDFGFRLFKLSKQFVLWTAVMTSNDQQNSTLVELGDKHVASSARSEEYFRELKHQIFKKGKVIRIDKYLVIHLRSLMGTTKLLNAPEKKTKKDNLPLMKPREEVATDGTRESEDFVDNLIESVIDDTGDDLTFIIRRTW